MRYGAKRNATAASPPATIGVRAPAMQHCATVCARATASRACSDLEKNASKSANALVELRLEEVKLIEDKHYF